MAVCGLKVGNLETKFPKKLRAEGTTNKSLYKYMPARFEYKPMLALILYSCILYFTNCLYNVLILVGLSAFMVLLFSGFDRLRPQWEEAGCHRQPLGPCPPDNEDQLFSGIQHFITKDA